MDKKQGEKIDFFCNSIETKCQKLQNNFKNALWIFITPESLIDDAKDPVSKDIKKYS